MNTARITILYRQLIDSSSQGFFEKGIWKATYEEFLLKSQTYNPDRKYATFQQMAASDGRANSLHYKCGFAAAGFIGTLHKKIPHLTDSLGNAISFDTHEFKVIESDVNNIESHRVAIHYITPVLAYYGNIGNYILLSATEGISAASPAQTCMLEMRPNLSIITYCPV